MSFFDDLFGQGKAKEKTTVTPTTARTYMPGYQFNQSTGYGGGVSMGPNGGSLQVSNPTMQNYGKFGQLTDRALQRTGGLINDLKGNANPFITARVRPLQQSINERRMDLSRGMSRRDVTGSLANNEMIKFDSEAQRQLADQRALATNDTLSALYAAEGLDQSVRSEVMSLADSYLKTSLSELELSLEGMRLALSGSDRQAAGEGSITSGYTKQPRDIIGGLGKVLSLGKAAVEFPR